MKKKKFRKKKSTFWKITVGGFVNQLIKNFWPSKESLPIDGQHTFLLHSTSYISQKIQIRPPIKLLNMIREHTDKTLYPQAQSVDPNQTNS